MTNEVVVRMRIEGYRWGVRKVRSCRHAKCRLGYGAGCVDTVPCAQGRAPTHKVWRARCNSRRATGVAGLGSPLPHLRRDSAHPSFICTGTWLTPATSALGLGSPLPTSAPGLGAPLQHLGRDWACPAHICTSLWQRPARCAPIVWRVNRGLRRIRHANQCSRRCFGEYPVHYPVQYREYDSNSLHVQSNRWSPPRRPR